MLASFAGKLRRFHLKPQHVVLGLLSLLLIGLVASTLYWRIDADLAWNLYVARLVDQFGMIPYRDIYVIDSPGTIAASVLIGRLIGYTNDLGSRLVDLTVLAGLSALTWAWLRRLGGLVAWCAVILFDLNYLEAGVTMALQKEYLMLLPLVGSLLIATTLPRLDDRLRGFLVGLLLGLIAVIKPHGALALPVIAAAMLIEIRARDGVLARRRGIVLLLFTAAGALLPLLAEAAYLIFSQALPAYIEVLTKYGPLYGQTTFNLQVISGPARIDYLASTLVGLNGRQVWLLPAGLGVMALLLPSASADPQRRQVWLMLALAGCYLVYPALTGQFYVYHWLPFVYFLLALAALCLAPMPEGMGRVVKILPVSALALALALRYPMVTDAWTTVDTRFVAHVMPGAPASGRSDQIAAYARQNFAPGETAQPLDWGNGAMIGLLLADVRPADRFVFDTPFYYDAHGDYIQGLRREFIADLTGERAPQWVIYVSDQPLLQGPGVDYNWPQLQKTMDEHYQLRYVGRDTFIYHRADGVARGVIVYPKPDERIMQAVLHLPDNLLWIDPEQAAKPALLAKTLAGFAAAHPLVTLDYAPLDGDAGPLLAWLSQNAYHLDEQHVANTVVADFVTTMDCAAKPIPATATFGGSMAVDSAAATLTTIGPGRYVCVEVDWKAEKAVGQFYHVALHVVGPDGRLVAQHDGVPAAGLAPTNTWAAGQTVADRAAIALPAGLAAGQYLVSLVVYDPGTGARLPVAGGDSLTIATFTIPAP